MQALAATHLPPELSVEQRTYAACDLAGMRVVITATGVGEVDLAVARDAEAARVLVNAADEPEGCAFVLPAVLRTGPVSVAVSTGGVSPYLAGWIRSRIGAALGPEIGELASLVGAARSAIRARSVATEGLAWDGFVEVLWALVRSGDSEAAHKEVDAFVASSTRNS
jgi:precorrin-2 dehydrogenase/sirohydrochlorin ferrochelatase